MKKALFITGTDTGIGKTFVAVGLIRAMKRKGLNVCPMKPVETGCRMRGGRLVPSDAVKLMRASGVSEPLDTVNPYRFAQHLAPAVAAKLNSARIQTQQILRLFARLRNRYDVTLVEGAGGVMVPLYKKYLFLDLMNDMDIPALIVARPGLGTINHTLLTISALTARGIAVLGVVFNHASGSRRGLSEKTNPEVIRRLGGVPDLGSVPYFTDQETPYARSVYDQIREKMLPVL